MYTVWTSVILLLILPITPTLLTTIVADNQLETLPTRFNRNARKSLSSEPEEPSVVPNSKPADIPCGKDQDYVQRLLRRQRKFDHGSQGVDQSPAERVQIPEPLAVGRLIWDQFHVAFNKSGLASYATTKFYVDIAEISSPEQWLGAAVHIFILSCGAIKLTFEIVASERPVSWQTAWAFVLDFVKMMTHISRSLALVSYRGIVITAFATYLVTLHIVENALQRHFVTGPVV